MHPELNRVNWQKALEVANKAQRCGAKTRAAHSCKSPAMPNGRCRMHGGKSPGAPCGAAHGQYKHGKCTNKALQQKKENLQMIRALRLEFPLPKESDAIYLEDIGIEVKEIKTQADVEAAWDEIWHAMCDGEISIQEAKVLFADLDRQSEYRLNIEINKLMKKKRKIIQGLRMASRRQTNVDLVTSPDFHL